MRRNDSRTIVPGAIALVIGLALTLIPAGALAAGTSESQTVTHDGVTATLTYGPPTVGINDTDLNMTISQKGKKTFTQTVDAPECGNDCYVFPKNALSFANLQGTGQPDDVVLRLFSGGASCCTIDEVYAATKHGYDVSARNFWIAGVKLEAIGPGHTMQFVTADTAFLGKFTIPGVSGQPIEILKFENDTFSYVTRAHPTMIRADAAKWWSLYLKQTGTFREGLIAPWAADEYNLFLQKQTNATLKAQVKKHRLTSTFVSELEKLLRQHHYG